MPRAPLGRVLAFGADAASVAVSCLLVAWGLWLLVTADPDGGRHPVGALLLAVGAVCGLLAALDARRRWRRLTRR